MTRSRRSAAAPAVPAPEVVTLRQWVAASGFGDLITVTDAGRLRIYDLDVDAAQFLAMSGEDAFDALMGAAVRAELGDDP